MTAAFLILAAAAAPAPVPPVLAAVPVPVVAPTPEFDPRRVDITGAGDVEFAPDMKQFPVGDFEEGRVDASWVLVRFDRAGAPVECETSRPFLASGFDQVLCNQLMRLARFRLARGYDLAFERGHVRINFNVAAAIVPVRPIRLLSGNRGREIELVFSPKARRNPCAVTTRGLSREDAQTICDAYVASDAARRIRQAHENEALADPVREQVRFAVAPVPASGQQAQVNWEPGIAPRIGPLAYPPESAAPGPLLAPSDGRIALAVSGDDYPQAALSNGLRGRAVILAGVSRDGGISTCRPLTTSGAPILDNTTCRLVVERGRFEFSQAAPAYEGLRYATYAINWNIAP